MARQYKDRITDGPDNTTVYQIIDETTGREFVARAIMKPVNVVQEGDQFGALAANRMLELDTDDTPLLAIDGGTVNNQTGYQTQYRQGGGAIPATLLPGQLFIADNGDAYAGSASGVPVRMGNNDALAALQNALAQHEARTDNPHTVTRAQLGAAAETDLTSHTSSRANPHGVTAAQVGAMPVSGGTFSGNARCVFRDFSGYGLRDITVQDAAGTEVPTYAIICRRQ